MGIAVRIAVDDVGTGEPALLCLPGWCGDRTVFDDVLRRAGTRRALALDLRAASPCACQATHHLAVVPSTTTAR